MERKRRKTANTDRLSKDDWLKAAITALGKGGVGAVRVEVLAEDLKVTKGSFYWHFKDRDALLAEVLRFWREEATTRPLEGVKRRSSDPRERIRILLDLATSGDGGGEVVAPGGRFEQAIREWGATSEAVREALRQVDLDRLTILSEMYVEAGMKRAQASAYAMLLYSYTVGSNRISSNVGRQALQALRQSIAEILTP